MALAPEVMLRGLAFVRHLYALGLRQSSQSGPVAATSILTFHDAVEMLLVLGLKQHDRYRGARAYQFNDYWTELQEAGLEVSQRGTMEDLNRTRVNLKHHAQVPSRATIEAARVHVRDFFIENTALILGVNFEDVSLSSIVTYDKPRTHLEQAERHMSAGEHEAAIKEIAFAFHYLVGQPRSEGDPWTLSRLRSDLSSLPLPGDFRVQATMREIIGIITKSIEQDRDTVRFITFGLTLGLDFGRWQRFRALTPRIIGRMSGEPLVERRHRVPPTLDQCRFCYEFVIDSALRLQEQQDATR